MSHNETITQLVNTGYWGPVDAELGIKAGFKCQYCNKDLLDSVDSYKEWQTDHLVPASAGGPDSEENYVICCRTCNFIKNRWNPASVHEGYEPTREQLIISARDYISKKRTETEQLIDNFKEIIGDK